MHSAARSGVLIGVFITGIVLMTLNFIPYVNDLKNCTEHNVVNYTDDCTVYLTVTFPGSPIDNPVQNYVKYLVCSAPTNFHLMQQEISNIFTGTEVILTIFQ